MKYTATRVGVHANTATRRTCTRCGIDRTINGTKRAAAETGLCRDCYSLARYEAKKAAA